MCKSLLQKTLKINKFHPYKPKFNHVPKENDDMKRLDFCMWMGKNILKQSFVENNIFSDKTTFNTNEVVSSQNCRYWSHDTPNFPIRSRRLYSQTVNVWCAISYSGIIGPYFIKKQFKSTHLYVSSESFFL